MEMAIVPNRASASAPLLGDLVRLCRPQEWTKNVFVLTPLLFSLQMPEIGAAWRSLVAVACFCLFSSAVYIVNDLIDREADRCHPHKQSRPIAAGHIPTAHAVSLAGALLLSGTGIALALLPRGFMALAGAYLANSALYCLWLKRNVIIDVMVIAVGFVLRLLAGCVAVAVVPSPWIVVCGFTLALVLGFGKRRIEIAQEITHAHRPTLQSYTQAKLDTLLATVTAVCLLSYILYTVAPDTVQRHQTDKLIYTIPFVAYGLFRYLFKTQEGKGGDGPAEILVGDWVFLTTGVLWGLSVATILLLA